LDFARLWEQAKDLWSRPIGKLIISSLGVFVVAAAILSYVWTRPTYVTLGKFEATDATQVAKKLNDNKIPFKNDANFTFTVPTDKYDDAKLALADLNLDPTATVWGIDSWKGKTSWSDTEFDKRRLWEEQTETNLARAIKTMSVVENARVDITLPSEPKLFASQETPPKATVMVQPKKGQQLTTPMVESIMQAVAGAVDGLDKTNVIVIDSSRSKVVSADAFKEKAGTAAAQPDSEEANVQLQVQKEYTDRWTQMLTDQLEKVAGPGNVSVLVNPTINWARVQEDMQQYTPSGTDGKGMILSQSSKKSTSDGTAPSGAGTEASGTTANSELGVPSYPGTTTGQGGTMSAENVENITNYLVNQTKTSTDKPGGSIEEVSVGVFLNTKTVDATTEQAMQRVVANAMGSKAKVEVAAVPFAPSLWDTLGNQPTTTPTQPKTPALLYVLLAIAGTLGIIGFGMLAFRPKKPVLEPVFAGPEAAMMGGIPVSELEMAAAADAYASQSGHGPAAGPAPTLSIGGEAAEEEEAEPLAPEEIALLGDDFLKELGVDPAKVRMREKVEKVAKANPEAVAQLLKTWIQDG
jgi:flagellar M-ring protein FliF